MGRSIALLLAAAVVAGASVSAQAADLLPPPPIVEPPPPPPDFGGWYLRGDVGVGATQMTDWRSSFSPNSFGVLPNGPVWNANNYMQDTVFAGAGVGYQFNNWLRGDLTGEYRFSSAYRATQAYVAYYAPPCVAGCFGADSYNANLSTALFMANAYVDLGTWYGITPFVGGGVGAAFHSFQGLTDHGIGAAGIGVARDSDHTNFAWAAMAGLAYNVTPNLKLEVGYRYIDMGRITSNPISCSDALSCFGERHSFNIASHDIRLGFRYMLGGFGGGPALAPAAFAPAPAPLPPPPPRAPLVRKY